MFDLFDNPTLEKLLKTKENQSFDRKSSRINWKDIGDEIIGFSHADGGVIAIGIERDLKITGVENLSLKLAEIKNACTTYIEPPVKVNTKIFECTDYKGQSSPILLVEIPPNDQMFNNQKREVFLRIGDENIKLNHGQIEYLMDEKGRKEYEQLIATGALLEDLDINLIKKYTNILESPGISTEEVLIGRDLAKNDEGSIKINMAGILLFGKQPERWNSRARIRILRYEGTIEKTGQRLNTTKDIVITGPLPNQIDQAFSIVGNLLRDLSILNKSGKFSVQREYPDFAWQETIVNAIAHRSYSLQGADIQIKIFEDHMEVISPGKFPGFVTEKNIKDTHYSRNPRVARVLADLGYVKEIGEGVNRVIEEMTSFGLPEPIFSEKSSAEVLVELKNNISLRIPINKSVSSADIEPEIFRSLNEDQKKILSFTFQNGKISTKECMDYLKTERMTALRRLKSLVNIKLIERVGVNGPNVYYKISKEPIIEAITTKKENNINKQEKLF